MPLVDIYTPCRRQRKSPVIVLSIPFNGANIDNYNRCDTWHFGSKDSIWHAENSRDCHRNRVMKRQTQMLQMQYVICLRPLSMPIKMRDRRTLWIIRRYHCTSSMARFTVIQRSNSPHKYSFFPHRYLQLYQFLPITATVYIIASRKRFYEMIYQPCIFYP